MSRSLVGGLDRGALVGGRIGRGTAAAGAVAGDVLAVVGDRQRARTLEGVADEAGRHQNQENQQLCEHQQRPEEPAEAMGFR